MSDDDLMDTISAAVEGQKEQVTEAPIKEAPTEQDLDAEQSKEHAEERAERDASGRFLPKTAKVAKEGETKEEPEPVEKAEAKEEEKPDISRPPRRLPVRTKGIWQTLSEPLREDIIAREVEFDRAFKRYDGLGPFAMEAEKNGTNLLNAFRSYVDLEDRCRKDPVNGVETLARTLGWNQKALAYAMAVRQGLIGQQGEQPRQEQPGFDEEALLTKAEQRAAARFEEQKVADQIQAFESDPKNVYFEDVRPDMARIVNAGLANNIKDAYDKACKLHPEIARSLNGGSAANTGQASKTAAVNQSRAAAKAIGGAPSRGSNAGAKTPEDGDLSIYDTVKAAVSRQRG